MTVPCVRTSVFAWDRPALSRPELERSMLDIVFLAAGMAFFVLATGYAGLCERL